MTGHCLHDLERRVKGPGSGQAGKIPSHSLVNQLKFAIPTVEERGGTRYC